MEHFILFGLMALAFGLLLFTIGPRITQNSEQSLSSPSSGKGFSTNHTDT